MRERKKGNAKAYTSCGGQKKRGSSGNVRRKRGKMTVRAEMLWKGGGNLVLKIFLTMRRGGTAAVKKPNNNPHSPPPNQAKREQQEK